MPEWAGCHEDVKRITKYSKTEQWLCETCVADLGPLEQEFIELG